MVRVKDLNKCGKLRESPAIQSGHVCEGISFFFFLLRRFTMLHFIHLKALPITWESEKKQRHKVGAVLIKFSPPPFPLQLGTRGLYRLGIWGQKVR